MEMEVTDERTVVDSYLKILFLTLNLKLSKNEKIEIVLFMKQIRKFCIWKSK